MTTKSWIVIDLDGTLCNINHRVHLAQAKQWDEFNALCTEDAVVPAIQDLIWGMEETGYKTLVVTGRDEKFRHQTEVWLSENDVAPDTLLMRPTGTFASDHELKLLMIERFFGGKDQVLESVIFAVDDRDTVVQAMRDYGLVVLQCREGDY